MNTTGAEAEEARRDLLVLRMRCDKRTLIALPAELRNECTVTQALQCRDAVYDYFEGLWLDKEKVLLKMKPGLDVELYADETKMSVRDELSIQWCRGDTYTLECVGI